MTNVFALQMQDPYEEPVSFEDFWLLWPKRQAKKDALKAWNKMTEAQQMAAVTALVDWRAVWISRNEMQYTPLPASWLNGERWEDELPPEYKPRHQSHQSMPVRPEDKPKSVMPEHVKALIAKLKERR